MPLTTNTYSSQKMDKRSFKRNLGWALIASDTSANRHLDTYSEKEFTITHRQPFFFSYLTRQIIIILDSLNRKVFLLLDVEQRGHSRTAYTKAQSTKSRMVYVVTIADIKIYYRQNLRCGGVKS